MTKKSKTTTQQQTVTTPNVPQYGQNFLRDSNQQIRDLLAGVKPSDLAPGLSPIQNYAMNFAFGGNVPVQASPMPVSKSGAGEGVSGLPYRSDGILYGMDSPTPSVSGLPYERGGSVDNGIIGRADPYIGEAADIVRQALGQGGEGYTPSLIGNIPNLEAATANAASIDQGDINRFINPYLDQVVGAVMTDAEAAQARQNAQMAANAAGAGAFGGSRFGVERAVKGSEDLRNLGSLASGLRGQAYNFAAGLAGDEAGRRQQANMQTAANQQQANLARFGSEFDAMGMNQAAMNQAGQFNAGINQSNLNRQLAGAGQLAGLGELFAGQGRADLGTLLGLGEMQAANQQQQSMAPLNLAQLLAQIQQSQIPGLSLQTGQTSNMSGTSTQSQGGLGSILQPIAGLAGSALTGGFNPFGGMSSFIGGLMNSGAPSSGGFNLGYQPGFYTRGMI